MPFLLGGVTGPGCRMYALAPLRFMTLVPFAGAPTDDDYDDADADVESCSGPQCAFPGEAAGDWTGLNTAMSTRVELYQSLDAGLGRSSMG